MAKGELACDFRVPVRGTVGGWGWKEERKEGQDGPSVVHQVRGSPRRKDLRTLFLSLISPRSAPDHAPAFPEIPDKSCLLSVPCFFNLYSRGTATFIKQWL